MTLRIVSIDFLDKKAKDKLFRSLENNKQKKINFLEA
jgi:hypothetical protein